LVAGEAVEETVVTAEVVVTGLDFSAVVVEAFDESERCISTPCEKIVAPHSDLRP
jgi:hypothetical protein